MSSDTARKIEAHLAALARIVSYYRAIAPEVDRQLDFARWQVKARDALGQHLPEEMLAQIEVSFSDLLRQLQKNLPLPQFPGNVDLWVAFPPNDVALTTSTISASGNVAILNALVTVAGNPDGAPVFKPILVDFQKLQEVHGRVGEAKARLRTLFPDLVTYFDAAEKSYGMAKLSPDGASAAASEIRTLLMKFRGELIDKARRSPRENKVGWEEMAERLTGDMTSEKFRRLADQGPQHERIYNELSAMSKDRYDFDVEQLSTMWSMAVEHILVTCGSLMQ